VVLWFSTLQYLKQVGAIDERNITTLHGSSIGAVVRYLLEIHKTIEEIILGGASGSPSCCMPLTSQPPGRCFRVSFLLYAFEVSPPWEVLQGLLLVVCL